MQFNTRTSYTKNEIILIMLVLGPEYQRKETLTHDCLA
jgi:hypothetical protein